MILKCDWKRRENNINKMTWNAYHFMHSSNSIFIFHVIHNINEVFNYVFEVGLMRASRRENSLGVSMVRTL
jgi:hypothetical protein